MRTMLGFAAFAAAADAVRAARAGRQRRAMGRSCTGQGGAAHRL